MGGDVGNMPPFPGIFPDHSAPIVRNSSDGRKFSMARWDMPSPKSLIEGRKSNLGVTNIRNAWQ
jgi:putative SOS response-associated peptidase YedK